MLKIIGAERNNEMGDPDTLKSISSFCLASSLTSISFLSGVQTPFIQSPD